MFLQLLAETYVCDISMFAVGLVGCSVLIFFVSLVSVSKNGQIDVHENHFAKCTECF